VHAQLHKRKVQHRRASLKEDMSKAVTGANLPRIQGLLQEAEVMGIAEEPWVSSTHVSVCCVFAVWCWVDVRMKHF
jgi:hypothetical protein